jgi:hypothetical protein
VITREQVPSVLDHQVYDQEGKKIGQAGHVFLDDATGEPEWASVRTGMFGNHESFVPIHDARLTEDRVEVPCTKAQVKDAPHVDVDSGGHLSEREERELYRHYGVDWDAGRRRQGMAQGDVSGGTAGAAGMAGTAAASGPGRERAVADTEAVPVERVRMVPEEHIEQETVRGQVRKERIDADIPEDARDTSAADRDMDDGTRGRHRRGRDDRH